MRQQAWEWANKDKKGEKVTARDTLAAVEVLTTITNIADKAYKEFNKERKAGLKAEQELAEYSAQGISTKDAFILVSLPQIVEDFVLIKTWPCPGSGMGKSLSSTVLFPGSTAPNIVSFI